MKIIIANVLNNENTIMAVEVFESVDGSDFAEILDFFTNLKAEFGHTVIKRRSTDILFSDGVRFVLTNNEMMEMKDVKEFNRIKEFDREGIQSPESGIILESKDFTKEPS